MSFHRSMLETAKHELLGWGTYGTVIKIEKSDSLCARKQISPTDGIDISAIRECTVLGKFRHPYVLSPTALEITNDATMHIYFPLASGDLYNWLNGKTVEQRYMMMKSTAFRVLCVLNELHRINIIHRDIKPSNILLDQNDLSYLADFGSSRENQLTEYYLSKKDLETTSSNSLNELHSLDMITYIYRPPESKTHAYTTQADIYSLGCTLIHILVGKYTGFNEYSIPPKPSEWVSFLDRFLQSITVVIPRSWVKLLKDMIRPMPTERPTALMALRYDVFAESVPPIHSTRFSFQPPTLIQSHPLIRSVLEAWIDDCKIFKNKSAILNYTSERVLLNLSMFYQNEKNSSQLNPETVILAGINLVLKLLNENYPHPKHLLKYAKPFLISSIRSKEIIQMESYIFLLLNFMIY
jgi:serine/threonine protein kinase